MVNSNIASTPTRRSTSRHSELQSNQFPDDLSDFPMNHSMDDPVPFDPSAPIANCSVPALRQYFQIPSEILETAQNLNLHSHSYSDDESLQEEMEQLLANRAADSSTAVPPHVFGIPSNDVGSIALETPDSLSRNGHYLGEIFTIGTNDDFDMLDAFPNSLVSMTRLIHYCRSAAVPLYLIDGILKLICDEVNSKRLDLNQCPSYRSTMSDLRNLFQVPILQIVSNPLERTTTEQENGIYLHSPTFPTFSFLEQLQDLLSMSDIFQDLDNLVVNPDNPWLPYKNADSDEIWEFHDGDWFRNAATNLSETDPTIFDLGIILYTDKTGTGVLNPHGMEPVVFTLTLFTESVRQNPGVWRPLGFMPEFRKSSSALERVQKQSKMTASRLVRNYHRVLDTILLGIVECQKSPPIVRIRIGNEWKFVQVRIFLEAVLGDALSNDVICGRVQNRTDTSLRLCRACHIPQRLANDPRHCCQYFVQRHIERIIISALGPETDQSNDKYFN